MTTIRKVAAAAAAGLLFIASPNAQQQQPQKAPSFRVRTDVVSVDVVVRDKSGAVVRDLKPDDFEIREDG
jgi:hypothetical protein